MLIASVFILLWSTGAIFVELGEAPVKGKKVKTVKEVAPVTEAKPKAKKATTKK